MHVFPTTDACCCCLPFLLQSAEAQQREFAARDGALAALQAEAAASQAGLQRELEETRRQLQGEVCNGVVAGLAKAAPACLVLVEQVQLVA